MAGVAVILIFVVSFLLYRRELQNPVYAPLREEGVIWKRTGFHLLHAVLRDKSDPLKPIQMRLGLLGLGWGAAVVMAAVAAVVYLSA
ncbi:MULTISPECIES: hypothetical protein [unclassified Leisingera]|uniref:hypothetical protein n=1 Tax=unclassified Leisingera TaxID=2614906 RepID=UPI00057D6121|nr:MULTISPECIES: hypothetical protein [unclassified Leisingera]KIC16045.1 hypothetical protein RA21_14655 [Leisingera sp. ANG-DT]KIC30802.1 hypothetical protein RA24_02165 [Leisingera sp. ANG-M6]KIC30878.1 hypothetical protein RA25_18350 [Leisingera sp. ANG-S5]